MVILQVTIGGQKIYFKGSDADFEWTKDRPQAKEYTDAASARADLVGASMAMDHYTTRAIAVAA